METQHQKQHELAEITRRLRRIEEHLSEAPAVKLNWLDSQDICQLLHVSKRTLAHYREEGLLPYSKMGGKVYYRLADIENYLAANLVRKEHQP